MDRETGYQKTFSKILLVMVSLGFVPGIFLSVFISSCLSYDQKMAPMKEAVSKKNYKKAKEILENSKIRTEDPCLYDLEYGSILYKQGDELGAYGVWSDAEKRMDNFYTQSIVQESSRFFVNDSAREYHPEPYEISAFYVGMILSYLHSGDFTKALIPVRALDHRTNLLREKKFVDPWSHFLSALAREAKGDWDGSWIDGTRAWKAYQHHGSSPKSLQNLLGRLMLRRKLQPAEEELAMALESSTKKEVKPYLFVVHELSPMVSKVSETIVSVVGDQFYRLSFPKIPSTPPWFLGNTGIRVGEEWHPSEEVVDYTSLARQAHENGKSAYIARMGARLLIKHKITQEAYQHGGPLGGLLMNLYGFFTETADTRGWTNMPGGYALTVLEQPPEKFTHLTICTQNSCELKSRQDLSSGWFLHFS